MTRGLTTICSCLLLAALQCSCGNSTGSGGASTPRTDVKAGSAGQPPGSELSPAPGNADPTGGKPRKGAESDQSG